MGISFKNKYELAKNRQEGPETGKEMV
jgi:hypothetical protein